MATQVGEAVVKLSFDGSGVKSELSQTEKHVSSFTQRAGSVIKGLGVALTTAFAAGTAAAIKFSKDSINAFNEAEKAQAKLAQSAKNQNWAEGAVEDLRAYNSELQKLGIIEDDVNAAGQAQLGTFALSAEAVKVLTPAMDDLIAATSGYEATADSATQMANLMGKVMTGNVGALTRYGVTLDEHQKKLLQDGDEMTRAATLAEVLKQNYGGFNEALAQTPQGKVKQLSNAFGDLQESFGAFIAGRGDLNEFFNNLETFLDGVIDTVVEMAPTIIDGISRLISKISSKMPEIIERILPLVADIIIAVATGLIENIPILIDCIVKIAKALAKAVVENLPKIIDALAKALPGAFLPIVGIITGSLILGKIKNGFMNLFSGNVINAVKSGASSMMSSLTETISKSLSSLGNGISNFIKAFASPEVLLGAAGFAAAAGSIALAILMIGSAVGTVLPALEGLMNNVIIPIATFIANTVLGLIDTLTNAIINITQQAFIPLGEFLANTFIAIMNTLTDVVVRLTSNAIIPLINTLSGAFIGILKTVGDILNGVVKSALEGVANIVEATGVAFEGMGHGIEMALNGVNAVLSTFADLIKSIADAVVAVVALVQGRSINYGQGYAHLFAEGGKVEGPGTSTSDSIPARLSNGEFVIKASSAKLIGYDILDDMNETGQLPSRGIVYNWAGVLANTISGTMESRTGGEINVFMTNQINNKLDAQDIGRTMIRSIREAA